MIVSGGRRSVNRVKSRCPPLENSVLEKSGALAVIYVGALQTRAPKGRPDVLNGLPKCAYDLGSSQDSICFIIGRFHGLIHNHIKSKIALLIIFKCDPVFYEERYGISQVPEFVF